ncbi:MAG: hypothetical protein HND51_14435 [Chloroflexi bacterium]|nr:hypothetical protein [Chloroflexota bacterium]
MLVQPIERGSTIPEEALTTVRVPVDEAVESMFNEISDVAGSRARFDLDPPLPVTASMLAQSLDDLAEVGSDAALQIPAGLVAFPIPISRFSSLAYGVQKGDHVNVIATMMFIDLDTEFQTALPNNTSAVLAPGDALLLTTESAGAEGAAVTSSLEEAPNLTAQIVTGGSTSPQGRAEFDAALGQQFYLVPSESTQRPRLVSQTLLQDIQILNVGTFLVNGQDVTQPEPVDTDGDGEPDTEVGIQPPDIITLIVSPQDAVTLNYLIYGGAELTLALRSPNDESRVFTEAVTLQFLLNTYNIPTPVKIDIGVQPRIDDLVPPVLENDQEP